MYKKLSILAAMTLLFTGCAKDINTVNGVINTTNGVMDTIGGIGKTVGRATGVITGGTNTSTNSGNYSVGRENINIMYSDRTKKNYGNISVVKYERNPGNRTLVYLNSCSHPNIGRLQCGGYLYKVTPQGWNEKERISFGSKSFQNNITLASGRYYAKLRNDNSGKKYYAIGDFVIKKNVTNYINLILE